ncbi:MAG: flagellar basal body L-ring protein FlgH [candidate division Zixibacteria bacterium]|nr:flagellar basal body L-ring protein FlgH [candidate division Zixibacteria bacterium]
MKMKRILIYLGLMLLLPFALKVKGGDFGQSQSLFTDIKANRVGDVLTVIISEQSRGSNQIQMKTTKSSKQDVRGGPGLGTLNFLPLFGIEGESKSTYDGKGQNIRNRSLNAKISVTVVAIRDNGDLVIEGTRIIVISGDKETISLSGVVRQRDVSPDNTIDSYLIADAEISYTGKGAASAGARPGFITRFFNWLF